MNEPHDPHNLTAIGAMTLAWGGIEEALERLVWRYIGTDQRGHIVTSQLQNIARANLLRELAKEFEADAGILDRIEQAIDVFDAFRLNRNTIIHAVDITAFVEEGTVVFDRRRKTHTISEPERYAISREGLSDLVVEMLNFQLHLETLHDCMRYRAGAINQPFFAWRKPPPLPDRFPIPDLLKKLGDEGR